MPWPRMKGVLRYIESGIESVIAPQNELLFQKIDGPHAGYTFWAACLRPPNLGRVCS